MKLYTGSCEGSRGLVKLFSSMKRSTKSSLERVSIWALQGCREFGLRVEGLEGLRFRLSLQGSGLKRSSSRLLMIIMMTPTLTRLTRKSCCYYYYQSFVLLLLR